jgi:hypothetical protein
MFDTDSILSAEHRTQSILGKKGWDVSEHKE